MRPHVFCSNPWKWQIQRFYYAAQGVPHQQNASSRPHYAETCSPSCGRLYHGPRSVPFAEAQEWRCCALYRTHISWRFHGKIVLSIWSSFIWQYGQCGGKQRVVASNGGRYAKVYRRMPQLLNFSTPTGESREGICAIGNRPIYPTLSTLGNRLNRTTTKDKEREEMDYFDNRLCNRMASDKSCIRGRRARHC